MEPSTSSSAPPPPAPPRNAKRTWTMRTCSTSSTTSNSSHRSSGLARRSCFMCDAAITLYDKKALKTIPADIYGNLFRRTCALINSSHPIIEQALLNLPSDKVKTLINLCLVCRGLMFHLHRVLEDSKTKDRKIIEAEVKTTKNNLIFRILRAANRVNLFPLPEGRVEPDTPHMYWETKLRESECVENLEQPGVRDAMIAGPAILTPFFNPGNELPKNLQQGYLTLNAVGYDYLMDVVPESVNDNDAKVQFIEEKSKPVEIVGIGEEEYAQLKLKAVATASPHIVPGTSLLSQPSSIPKSSNSHGSASAPKSNPPKPAGSSTVKRSSKVPANPGMPTRFTTHVTVNLGERVDAEVSVNGIENYENLDNQENAAVLLSGNENYENLDDQENAALSVNGNENYDNLVDQENAAVAVNGIENYESIDDELAAVSVNGIENYENIDEQENTAVSVNGDENYENLDDQENAAISVNGVENYENLDDKEMNNYEPTPADPLDYFENDAGVQRIPDKNANGYYVCSFCSKSFSSKKGLDGHDWIHRNPYCALCRTFFSSMEEEKKHKNLIHSDSAPIRCYLCPMEFRIQSTLKVHLRTHKSENTYSCSMGACKETFFTKLEGIKHVKVCNFAPKYGNLLRPKIRRPSKRYTPITSATTQASSTLLEHHPSQTEQASKLLVEELAARYIGFDVCEVEPEPEPEDLEYDESDTYENGYTTYDEDEVEGEEVYEEQYEDGEEAAGEAYEYEDSEVIPFGDPLGI